jgi:hypothetical protein
VTGNYPLPTALFRFGLTKNLELRLSEQFAGASDKYSSETRFGLSDLEIGTKIQILKNDYSNAEIAFITHLLIPSGSGVISNDNFGKINKIAISHGFNNFMDLGYNIGYNYFGVSRGDLTYSVVFRIGLSDKIGFYLETFGEYIEFESWISNFDTGITYSEIIFNWIFPMD